MGKMGTLYRERETERRTSLHGIQKCGWVVARWLSLAPPSHMLIGYPQSLVRFSQVTGRAKCAERTIGWSGV